MTRVEVDVEHLAHPDPERPQECIICHAAIHQAGPVWVHTGTGSVAAPTP